MVYVAHLHSLYNYLRLLTNCWWLKRYTCLLSETSRCFEICMEIPLAKIDLRWTIAYMCRPTSFLRVIRSTHMEYFCLPFSTRQSRRSKSKPFMQCHILAHKGFLLLAREVIEMNRVSSVFGDLMLVSVKNIYAIVHNLWFVHIPGTCGPNTNLRLQRVTLKGIPTALKI